MKRSFPLLCALLLTVACENGPDVAPEQLTRWVGLASRVVVLEREFGPGDTISHRASYRSSRRADILALRSALRVERPQSPFHCMCDGNPAIGLYLWRLPIGRVTVHHGQSVRWMLWGSDAMLTDPEPLLKWFDERGVKGPREEYEHNRLEKKRRAQNAFR